MFYYLFLPGAEQEGRPTPCPALDSRVCVTFIVFSLFSSCLFMSFVHWVKNQLKGVLIYKSAGPISHEKKNSSKC